MGYLKWCDIVPMDVCQLLLGRLWLYDMRVLYGGFKYIYFFVINRKKTILTHLKLVLDPKPSKREGEALITYGKCQQELKKGKVEFVLVKEDEIKEMPNLELKVNIFSQLREIDTRVSPQLLLIHSLWKAIAQITFMVLTSTCE